MGGGALTKTLRTIAWKKFRELCGLDTRSLALFRIGLGLATMFDIIDRLRDLTAHYSDDGIVPRSLVLDAMWNPYWFSFYMVSGSAFVIAIIFCINFIIAFLLMIGYRTRLMSVLTWIFVLSAQNRNLLVGHGGDNLHRVMCFFSMFVPIGDAYSVDAALQKEAESPDYQETQKTVGPREIYRTKNSKKGTQGTSKQYFRSDIATIALICQLLFMYFCAFWHKTGKEWTEYGTSAWLALQLDFFRRDFGDLLLMMPSVVRFFSFAVLYWQIGGVICAFMPIWTGPFRSFSVLGYLTMHVSFFVAFRLGQFGMITCGSILLLLPPWFWDSFVPFVGNFLGNCLSRWRLGQRKKFTSDTTPSALKLYVVGDCQFCRKSTFVLCEFFQIFPQISKIVAVDKTVVPSLKFTGETEPCTCGNHGNLSEFSIPDQVTINFDSKPHTHAIFDEKQRDEIQEKCSQRLWLGIVGVNENNGKIYTNGKLLWVMWTLSPLWSWMTSIVNAVPSHWMSFFKRSKARFVYKQEDSSSVTGIVKQFSAEFLDSAMEVIFHQHLQSSSAVKLALEEAGKEKSMSDYVIPTKNGPSVFEEFISLTSSFVKFVFVGFFFLLIIMWNLRSSGWPGLGPPAALEPIFWASHLDQGWSMFAPRPPSVHWWYTIEGILDDNTKVELFANGAWLSLEPNIVEEFKNPRPKPDPFPVTFKNHRWFKYFENGYNNYPNSNNEIRLQFGRWLCRNYNREHLAEKRLYTFSVNLVSETVDTVKLDGTRHYNGHSTMWNHICFDKPAV